MSRSIRLLRCALLLAAGCLAACGASSADGGPSDGGTCTTFISFEPAAPTASPTTMVRANAVVENAPGVLQYTWSVSFQGAPIGHSPAQADNSAIAFPATVPGVYDVRVAIGGVVGCPSAQGPLNVMAPGANQGQVRLRITPPASAGVPPFEKTIVVLGGASFSLGTIALDPGVMAAATVQSGGAGVASYLRLMPVAAREAAVEQFTAAGGDFTARLLSQPHDVLVIPSGAAYAPWLVEDWQPTSPTLDIGTGTAVSGVVRGPGGAGLVGAKVQLKIGQVPSTLATTATGGAFSVLVQPDPGAVITVDVTPPDGSGLPRLRAQSATLDLAQALQISYASLALRDLGGATIRRQGAPLPGAKVSVVGGVAAAGTVTAGATSASASGTVQIAATASGAGQLPPTLAPARPLAAVVEVTAGDHAVAAIDLTSSAPSSIDAPPAVSIATVVRRPDGAPIADAVLDAVPVGALALAGVTSSVRARSGTGGQLTARLAAGGHYDLRVHDPLLGRGAPLIVLDVTAPTIAASYTLRPGLTATGKLLLQGSPTPVGGAAVQILCSACTGVDRSRPLAEGTSQPDGSFTLVVPDPGTR